MMGQQPADATLVVGPGRVGATLALALDASGWPVAAVASRRLESASTLARRLGRPVAAGTLDSLEGPFPVAIIAVVDAAVSGQARRLVERGLVDGGSVVLHVSGIHSSLVLQAARDIGAATGSMHPLQTFSDPETAARYLPGSHWFVEGAQRAREVALRIVSRLDGTAHVIATGDKALYHASASIACNLFTALLDAALQTATAAGLAREEMMQALYPLVRTALDNALAHGTGPSLTGPVSRGDVETVRAHVRAIAGIENLPGIYRALAHRSVDMALESGRIEPSTAAALRDCLAE